jgi:methyltransferase (TIGR00027 family)
MTRTHDDSWDLTTGVGATATMVAAARAVASRGPDPVINDPFAQILVRAVGLKLFTQIVDGSVEFIDIGAGWLPAYFGIRSRAFDDFVADACRSGIRQAVIVASGLDCRAYRLDWPPAMTIYELDQPAVIGWKQSLLTNLGYASPALHRCVGIDLRRDWPTALQRAGFDEAKPTAWIVEGLLVGYLPPGAHDEILDSITALSASGSRIVADHIDIRRPEVIGETLNHLNDAWRKFDPTLNLRGLTFFGTRKDPALYLAERGWITHDGNLTDLFRVVGRPTPAAGVFPPSSKYMRFFTGIRD